MEMHNLHLKTRHAMADDIDVDIHFYQSYYILMVMVHLFKLFPFVVVINMFYLLFLNKSFDLQPVDLVARQI